MLKFLKGNIQRRFLLDIWGFYRLNYKIIDSGKVDRTLIFFFKIYKALRELWRFRNRRYVYQLKNFLKFNLPKKLDDNFFKTKLLTYYYFSFTKNKLKFIFYKSFKVQNTPIHYLLNNLEGRFIYILFKLGFEKNLFLIKQRLIFEKPFVVNNKLRNNYNIKLNLGDWCYIRKNIRLNYKYYFLLKFDNFSILQWFPKNIYFNYYFFLFFLLRNYRLNDIFFINKLDLFKLNELNHFLR